MKPIMRLGLWAIILLILVACGSLPRPDVMQGIQEGVIYKRDMRVCIGDKCREGVLIGPQSLHHKFEIESFGNLDLFTFSTCHREETTEKHAKRKWFRDNRKVKGDYYPAPGLETGYCPVYVGGYDLKGRHSWAFIDFEDAAAKLPAAVHCNGKFESFRGVSACQSRQGLVQVIEFAQEATVDACGITGTKTRFEFKVLRGECVAVFFSGGEHHRLTLIGYDKIITRSK